MPHISTVSDMLRLFQEGVPSYEPAELQPEKGCPQDSLFNLNRLLAQGLVIQDIWVRPTGVLVIFATGEQYYAPGLRVAAGEATEVLAEIAAKAGFGPVERLTPFYKRLPAHYTSKLPSIEPASCPRHPSTGFLPLTGGNLPN